MKWIECGNKLRGRLLGHGTADIDEVNGNDAEAYPALHPGIPFVEVALEAVSSLDHTDTTLGAGRPLLVVAEPALFLFAPALAAAGRARQ